MVCRGPESTSLVAATPLRRTGHPAENAHALLLMNLSLCNTEELHEASGSFRYARDMPLPHLRRQDIKIPEAASATIPLTLTLTNCKSVYEHRYRVVIFAGIVGIHLPEQQALSENKSPKW